MHKSSKVVFLKIGLESQVVGENSFSVVKFNASKCFKVESSNSTHDTFLQKWAISYAHTRSWKKRSTKYVK